MPGVTGMIADISPGADKAKNFGYMSAIINSGFILGPGFGGFLAEFSHRLPFYFAGTLGAITFIMSLVLIHNPKKKRQMVSININLNYSLKSIGKSLSRLSF